jgi:uncharacterized protein
MEKTITTDVPFNSASFNDFLAGGRLMGSRCKREGALYLPPRALCPADFRSEMEWVEFSGRGRLAAFSIIHIGTQAMIEAGFDRQHPYCTGVVALEEGPQISAQILDVNVLHPETIQIGMPLVAAFVERGQQTILAFRPA